MNTSRNKPYGVILESICHTQLMATPFKPKSLALFLASLSFTPHIQSVSNSCELCFQTMQNLTTSTCTTLVQATIICPGLLNSSLTGYLVSNLYHPPLSTQYITAIMIYLKDNLAHIISFLRSFQLLLISLKVKSKFHTVMYKALRDLCSWTYLTSSPTSLLLAHSTSGTLIISLFA